MRVLIVGDTIFLRKIPLSASRGSDKAIAAELTFRSLTDTVADTLRWDKTRSQDQPLGVGPTADGERGLPQVLADQSKAGNAENPAH